MGFRDDFFGLVTVMFAWTSLRLAKNPSPGRAVAAGVAGAVACLTRITSLAFVAPALAFVAVSLGAGERDRGLRATAIAIAVAALLLAPFLIDCWIRLGDPLFTINTHTGFYLTRGTHSRHPSVGIARFLFTRLGTDPVHAMDSLLRGLIVYPWDNKWSGLAKHWSEPLAWALKLLCAPGLVMWLWTRNGRLLLVTLVGALLPFAVTWDVFPEWRFTLHAVPFLVIAAVDFVARTVGAVRLWFDERNASRIEARARVRTIFASVGLSFALPATVFALAPVTFANELARGNPAGIAAGDRDWLFFASDWYSPRKEGDVTYRYADGREATIRVPLVRGGAFDCLVRMDPTPALVALDSADLDVEVSINGVWWQRLALRYDPQRVGQQTFRVPEGVLEPGINRLRFRAIAPATGSHRADESSAFRLWYLRVAPG